MSATETLRGLGACHEAVAWASAHGGSLAELWRDCPRGDWLLWYAGQAGASLEGLVRAAAGCAELTLPYAGAGRGACEAAIAAARAWADAPSAVTAAAARAAAYAARAAYAAYAAYAADAARAAARAADAAVHAAVHAAIAADAADAGAKMRAACADVVREHIPFVAVAK